jgi:hypothetical protein
LHGCAITLATTCRGPTAGRARFLKLGWKFFWILFENFPLNNRSLGLWDFFIWCFFLLDFGVFLHLVLGFHLDFGICSIWCFSV